VFNLNKETTKRLIVVHGWSGVLLGLVLYVVILTGALAVFSLEIGRWSVSGAKSHSPLTQPLDTRVRQLAETVEPEYLDEIVIYATAGGHIMMFFHTHGMNERGTPDDQGVMFELDPVSLEILTKKSGFGSELFGKDPEGALDEFIVDLHVNLYAPEPFGLYATGVLGLIMLLAAISGLLVHKHLIKDIFVAPRQSGTLLSKKDRHVLAGTWGLPFAFVLAFTGSFFSFAFSLGLPLVSATAFDGDQMAMIEALAGAPKEHDESPGKLANVDAMVTESIQQVNAPPIFLLISHFGRADASVSVYHNPSHGSISGKQNKFNGSNGELVGPQPRLGTKPSAGDTTFNLMGALHFGHFAGLISKLVWLSLGFAMCYVVITGMQMWLKRREDSAVWRLLGQLVPYVGYGLPICLCCSAVGYFFGLRFSDPLHWTPKGFGGGAVLTAIPMVLIWNQLRLNQIYQTVLGMLLVILPLLRILLSGTGWIDAVSSGNGIVMSVDLIFFCAGISILYFVFGDVLTKRSMERFISNARLVIK